MGGGVKPPLMEAVIRRGAPVARYHSSVSARQNNVED